MTAQLQAAGQPVLLADIGGTNARFALLRGGAIGAVMHLVVSDYPSFAEAMAAYLRKQSDLGTIGAAHLAVAGTVENGRCVMTNSPWVIDAAELSAAFAIPAVRVINDFAAVGWSLSAIPKARLRQLGGGHPVPGAPLFALGPGTGLGMTTNVPLPHGRAVLPSEGGHATLAGVNPREDAVIGVLRRKFGHVSAERALSGSGLENLYDALVSLDGLSLPPRAAPQITKAGVEGSCATCREAVDMFCALLGSVAGNLALVLGAKGGIYVAGGIIHHMMEHLAGSQFRARFEDKGRFRSYLAAIPVYLVLEEDVAFIGLKQFTEVVGVG
ncbi:glucokinase [Rhodopseudomonas palustris]|uniref:Glucokinase n=1 Tax=Rhodopseudomonas palustris (strain BisB18) TaxID=316056 RepID=Q20XJ1_RHOPB